MNILSKCYYIRSPGLVRELIFGSTALFYRIFMKGFDIGLRHHNPTVLASLTSIVHYNKEK